MALQSGTRLGPYEITAQIGVGGMGEVYRATDTKLKRDVAVKVLPSALAGNPERLVRFQREAEVLASLNHPNIAAIYGLEEADSTKALVMELVEGPTLADRIAQGAIPVDEALPIAKRIAEALEAAHEQGIIHRDLKPANVKVRPDGTVKVLDFGLAKALEPTGAMSPGLSQAPTITTPAMTQAGMILGTAAYMSPEQAKGRAVDKRSDVWAFGAVLYEMVTGKRAFGGDDISDTLANVLKVDPDWTLFPAGMSPVFGTYIRRCLHKDSKQRVHDIADVRLALEGAFETSGSQTVESGAVAQPAWRQPVPVAAMAAVVAVLVTGLVGWSLWPVAEPQPVNQFAYRVPDDQVFRSATRSVMALAPDGRSFVYNTSDGLYLRTMGELEARLIPGTEDAIAHPFFSPDGQSVGYAGDGELKRIAISGGAPVVITEVVGSLDGAIWGPDGTILFGQDEGIYRVPATGGTPALVIAAEDGEQLDSPQLLPDGDTVLFSVRPGGSWDDAQIVVQSLSSGERTIVLEGGSDARYLPTRHLVYALGNGLFGIAFDADTLSVTGGAVPLAQGLMRATTTAGANYGVSDDGTLAYVSGGGNLAQRSLVWVDREGREEIVSIEPGEYVYPRTSPDGSRVALDDRSAAGGLWIWDFTLETRTRLTVGEGGASYPAWTPDSERIAYATNATDIDWKAANNTGSPERLAESPGAPGSTGTHPYFFTPTGAELVFREQNNPETRHNLGMIAVDDAAEPIWLLREPFNERNAVLSPDGRWMAYDSDESGQYEIYVRPFPNVDDDRVLVSNAGGVEPLWSPDGRELFYIEPAGAGGPAVLMAVTLEEGGTAFSVDARGALIEWPYLANIGNAVGRNYDVSSDGQRFLGIKVGGTDEATQAQVTVVQNWFEELRRLVPN